MKTILRIARVELASLFYSPIAWFLLILFLIQVSMSYIGKLDFFVTSQDLGRSLSNLTYETFSNPQRGGLFLSGVLKYLYMYIPLITMGLISREMGSGTIKLLFSSPVKLSEVVIGKYVAMLAFNLCMILMLSIIVSFAAFQIDGIDWGLIFSGLLAIFLLLSAYAAIGLFMSSLSTYQVVAAIATFAVFALLSLVGGLWQDKDFIRDLTGYLSISGRTETMIMGLMTTRDVLYYLLITAMFLVFTWLKLKSNRKSISFIKNFGRYSIVVILVLIVGYFSSQPGNIGYWDVTRTKINTLSVQGQEVLKEIGDEPLEVTTYINLFDNSFSNGHPTARIYDIRRWERYMRFKPNIKLNYVYYYDTDKAEFFTNPSLSLDDIAKQRAKAYKVDLDLFKKPAEIKKIIDLYPENNRLVMLLKFKGKTTFLRTFDDNDFWPSEIETAAALKRLTVPLPKIAFLQGEEERSIEKLGDRHYRLATSELRIRQSLVNQGFDIVSLNLKDEEIPQGLTALVIADPRADFNPTVLTKIERYIDEGGNLLVASEPEKKAILKPIFDRLGVQAMEGTLLQEDKNFSADQVKSFVSDLGDEFGRGVGRLSRNKMPINTKGVFGLNYDSVGTFKVQPLLITDGAVSWNKLGSYVLDSADVKMDPNAGEFMKSYPTVLALTRTINGKEQRVLVAGDADFLSNQEISRGFPMTGNKAFFQGFLGWFSYGKFPIDPTWEDPGDSRLNLTGESITPLRWTMLGVIPGILLLFGTVLLIRRKRK